MNLICHWGEKNTVDYGGERRVSQKSLTWKTTSKQAEYRTEIILWTLVFSGPAESKAWGIWRDRTFACWPGRFGHHSMRTDWVGMTDFLVLTLSLFLSCPGAKYIRFGRTQALLYPAEAAPLILESKEMAVKLGTVNDSFMLHRFSCGTQTNWNL